MLKKIASNTMAQIASKGITSVISLFLIALLTKYFPIEVFGQYNKVYNYLAIFAFLADLGLYTISIREVSKNPQKASAIIGNMMSLRLILGVVFVLVAYVLACFLPGYGDTLMLYALGIVGIFTVLSLLNSSVLAYMQATMKMEYSLFSGVMGKIITFLIIVVVLLWGYPLSEQRDFFSPFLWVLSAGVIGIGVNLFLNYWYVNRFTVIGFCFDWTYMRQTLIASLPYGVALFLSVVYFKVDVILLSLLEPASMADQSIALYSLPMKIIEVLMVVGVFFLNSLLPSLSGAFQENKKDSLGAILSHSFRFLSAFGLGILVMGSLFGEHVIRVLATDEYLLNTLRYTSLDVISLVLFLLVFYFLGSLYNYIFIASKNEKTLLLVNIFLTVFNIAGNLLVIPIRSFYGSAWVTLTSQILLFVIGAWLSRKIVVFVYPWKFLILTSLISASVYWCGSLLLKEYSLGLYGDLIVYGGGIFVVLAGGLVGVYFLEKRFSKP